MQYVFHYFFLLVPVVILYINLSFVLTIDFELAAI